MRVLSLTTILLLGLIAPAAAHPDIAGGFHSGFAHPFSGLDHLLAMLSIGMWSVSLGRPLAWALPLTFPVTMIIGGALALAGMSLPVSELLIALSVIVLGIAVAAAWKAKPAAALCLVALFALFHGYAHGAELPSATDPLAYVAGFVGATVLLHLSGMGLGLMTTLPRGAILLRAAGVTIATAGIGFLFT